VTDPLGPLREVREVREEIVGLLPRLRRFARAITRHAADADDLVQITVERALTHLDQRRADTRLESWMFGIMKNAWVDEMRARGRRSRVLAPEEFGENVAEPASASHHELLVIEDALGRLPEDQRMAIALGQWGLRGYGMMAIEDAQGFIGRIGFYHPYDLAEPPLVYVLGRRSWGIGYATEAVTLILNRMFATHQPPHVLSRVNG